MRDPLLSGFSRHNSEENTWIERVRENLAQLLAPSRLSPAHDGARHAVARWITIEAIYRLF